MVEIRKIQPDPDPEPESDPNPNPEPTQPPAPDPRPDPREAAMADMRAQIQGLTVLVSNVLAARGADISVGPPPPAEPLEPRESERDRVLAHWASEPRVQIFIAPDENDQRAANEMAAKGLGHLFPPRVFQVNGVQLSIPVGESTTVPESIAALYEYTLNPWKAQHKLPPLTFDAIAARMG